MTLGHNPFNPYRSLPTLAAINRRRTELNAYQARHEAAEPAIAADELPAEYPAHLPEESRPLDDQEDAEDLQLSYPGDAYPNEYPGRTFTQIVYAHTTRTSRPGFLRHRGSHRE